MSILVTMFFRTIQLWRTSATQTIFAGTLLGMSSCASYVSRTHNVIDDVTRSQSRSNIQIDISPSIFKLERRSKAQNIGNANGYLKVATILKILKYQTQLQFDYRYEKSFPNYARKMYFHDDAVIDDVTGWSKRWLSIFLYKWYNNTFIGN